MIKELDVVRLRKRVDEFDLDIGTEGTVVMVYTPTAVEVEFADGRGVTKALATLPVDILEVTWSSNE